MNKREKILNAALETYSVYGFEESNMEKIAERAKVGKGTIYLYFKSKEDLFMKTIDFAMMSFNNQLENEIAGCESAWDSLYLYLDNTFKLIVNNHKLARIVVRELPDFTVRMLNDPKAKKKMIFNRRIATIKGILECGVKNGEFKHIDTEIVSMIIMGTINLFIMKFMMDGQEIRKEHIDGLKKIINDILKKED